MSSPARAQAAPGSDSPDAGDAHAWGSPQALVPSELSISLDDVALLDWIQAVQIFAKHAVITVLHAEGVSRIWCSEGMVIDACSGGLRGEDAFHRIASIERGRVWTELRAVHGERTIRNSTTWLLLEAARRKDEGAKLERKLAADPLAQGDHADLGELEAAAALEGLGRGGPVEGPGHDAEGELPLRDDAAHPLGSMPATPVVFASPGAPPRSSRSWGWPAATLVTGAVAAGAVWLGTRASVAPMPAAVAASAAQPAAFSVVVRAEPSHAELRLDGQVAGRGVWTAELPRDGVAHELRVSADGFLPLRILFVDTPPPAEIRLEPQPSAVMPAAAVLDAAAAAPGPRSVPVNTASGPPASAEPQRRSTPASLVGQPSPGPVRARAAGRKQPHVQIIGEDEPPAQPR